MRGDEQRLSLEQAPAPAPGRAALAACQLGAAVVAMLYAASSVLTSVEAGRLSLAGAAELPPMAVWGLAVAALWGGLEIGGASEAEGLWRWCRPVGRGALLAAPLLPLGACLGAVVAVMAAAAAAGAGAAAYALWGALAATLCLACGVLAGGLASSRSEGMGLALVLAATWACAAPLALHVLSPAIPLGSWAPGLLVSAVAAWGITLYHWQRYAPRRGLGILARMWILTLAVQAASGVGLALLVPLATGRS